MDWWKGDPFGMEHGNASEEISLLRCLYHISKNFGSPFESLSFSN